MPIGGAYTMTAQEAADAANAFAPKLVIPIHYGDIVGSEADAQAFASACNCPVKALAPGESTSR